MTMMTIAEERENYRIKKNLIILGLSVFLLFTSYHGISILQSSVHLSSGSHSLAVKVGTMAVSSLLFGAWFVKKITVKWAIVTGMCSYNFYFLGNFFASSRTYFLLSGMILGMFCAPMWTGFATYISQLSRRQARNSKQNPETTIRQNFANLTVCVVSSFCTGSFIASTVLSTHAVVSKFSDEQLSNCGVNFCPSNVSSVDLTSFYPPDENDMNILIIVFMTIGILPALPIVFFLDPMSRFDDRIKTAESPDEKPKSDTFNGMIKVIFSTKMLLLFPSALFTGFSNAFIIVDFSAAYVTCGLGVHMIGYIMMAYGAFNTIGSISVFYLVKLIGTIPLMVGASILNVLAIWLMFIWSDYPNYIMLLYVIAVAWGLADSVYQSIVKASFGTHFPDQPEEAFSVMDIMLPLGNLIGFGLQPYLCNIAKLIIALVLIGFGSVGFVILHVRYNKVEQKDYIKYGDEESLPESDEEHELLNTD